MKDVLRFILKGIVKSKYILFAFLAMIVAAMSFLMLNHQQPSSALKEFEKTFVDDENHLNFIISQYFFKDAKVGLSKDEQISLGHLIIHENHLKDILQEIRVESLDFVTEHKKYIEAYETFTNQSDVIVHTSNDFFKPLHKIELLERYHLPYLEEETPWNTALFTKQLFQIFFSPATAFIFLLLFVYKYISDRENRTFDFLKLNSLSPVSVYYGYLVPFLMMIAGYILIAVFISFLPVLITGNLNTIHYPIELEMVGENKFVFVWKWLIYMPISWGVFLSLFLGILIALLKMRLPMGLTLTFFAFLPLSGYLIFTQFGFLLFNPLHLMFFYEEDLLTSNYFIIYLLLMFCLFAVVLIALYPIFNMENSNFQIHFKSTQERKQYLPKKKWKLLQFEYIKSKRKNRVILNIAFLFLIIGGTLIYVNHQYLSLPKKYSTIIDGLINTRTVGLANNETNLFSMETEREILLAEGEVAEGLDEEIESVKSTIESVQLDIKRLKEFSHEIDKEDFVERFRQEVFLEELKDVKEMAAILENQAGLTILASIEQNRILDEKNMTPWQMNYLLNTNYDHPKVFMDDEVQYAVAQANYEQSVKYDNSALFFLYKLFDWNMIWLTLAVFVFLLWTSISEEYRPTLSKNFLLTKPVSFKSVYVSKWIYNLFVTYLLLFGVLSITFLISILFGGLGESQYPMLVYSLENKDGTLLFSYEEGIYFYFESLIIMLLKCGLLIVGQIFFLNSLFSLVGKWLKNQYAAIIIVLLLILTGIYFGNSYIEASWSYLNPFLYFDTWHVVDGWRSIEANSSKVNDIYGTIVLFLSGLLLFIAGLVGRERK